MKHTAAGTILVTAAVWSGAVSGTVTVRQQPAERTVEGLTAAEGLEVTLWASEPDLTNPTNIAIDERGRVWVLEAVNYRRALRNQTDIRPEGDRIVILEDTDGDGRADDTTVFDQNPQIRAPLGIAVLGDKVIVSQAPDVIVYTKDHADRIVKREVLLSGWRGVDNDHGLHAIVFGPDGRYYFNTGNAGYDVTDRSGARVRSAGATAADGSPAWGAGYFFEGAAMAVNPDGTGLQVLAHNFRNPYELALDSFGNIWQTDNDDDGNAWVRANYVIEGGNYGFRGPHGRTWREDRGSHFHSELPGVVPNLLRLGPGSPCGLVVYEGTLLPERYRGSLLHAEAGRRVIAAFDPKPEGAGFSTDVESIVVAEDTWFRPSDVAVAPDGAVFIADWYDPAVGGHGMGDPQGLHGRIYRLAPPRHRPATPALDLESEQGLVAAFGSPAQAVFYLAHQRLKRQGPAALPVLTRLAANADPVLRARALWVLGTLGQEGARVVRSALADSDPRFRILGLRVLRASGADVLTAAERLLRDPSAQVRREIAAMLYDPARMTPPYLVGDQQQPPARLLDALIVLAKQYDGQDRWYLEAIGIAARGREDALYAKLREVHPAWNSTLARLLWGIRAPASIPYLIETLNSPSLTTDHRLEALDVLAAMAQPDARAAVEAVITASASPGANVPPPLVERAFGHVRRQLFSMWAAGRKSANLPVMMQKAFGTPALQAAAIDLAGALADPRYEPALLKLAVSGTAAPETRAAAIDALAATRNSQYLDDFDRIMWPDAPPAVAASAVRAIAALAPPDLNDRAETILLSDAPNDARAEALRVLLRTTAGASSVVALAEQRKFPPELRNLAASLLNGGALRQDTGDPAALAALRERAAEVFPPVVTMSAGAIPTTREMEQKFRADAAAGRTAFESPALRCSACHSVGGAKRIGPDLTGIGTKLGRQGLLDAILSPSAAIAFGYESWAIETKRGEVVVGIVAEDTPERVIVKIDETQERRLRPAEIASRSRSRFSLMPENLVQGMTEQQLVDLLEYLLSLKAEVS